jgi:hypothetical protein
MSTNCAEPMISIDLIMPRELDSSDMLIKHS